MNLRKLGRNHFDRMSALLAKRAGIEYPTIEMIVEANMYAAEKVKAVKK